MIIAVEATVLGLRRFMLKYLGMKYISVCNEPSNNSSPIYIDNAHVYTYIDVYTHHTQTCAHP